MSSEPDPPLASSDEVHEAPSVPVWPPRVLDPRALPGAPDPLKCRIDETAEVEPVPEPQFSKGRMAERIETQKRRGTAQGSHVAFDPKNPSGRTRGDAVLRPTPEDRVARLRRQGRRAALTGAIATTILSAAIAQPSFVTLLVMILLGACAGLLAYHCGDNEMQWLFSLGATSLVLIAMERSPVMFLAAGCFGVVGYLIGYTRDASMD